MSKDTKLKQFAVICENHLDEFVIARRKTSVVLQGDDEIDLLTRAIENQRLMLNIFAKFERVS
ncbi:MAG: hypothetical protein WBI40_13115 [Methylococcaceae bacterium]